MMPFSSLRSVARRYLAGAAMFGFCLNVATPTIAHGCGHPASAGAPAATVHHAAHQGHASAPAPAEQPSHDKKCRCVGHSCGTALAVPVPVAAGPRAVPVFSRNEPVRSADRLSALVQHLLPFAVGPPSGILA